MRDTVRPPLFSCPGWDTAHESSHPSWPAFLPRPHKWNYSHSWNGNSSKVLPWWEGTRGIPRSGWRCYHCGKFVWDQSDAEFALSFAYYTNTLAAAMATMEHGRFVAKEEAV